MEITKRDNNIIIKHKLSKNQNYKYQKGESIESFTIYKKPQIVSGFSNMCEDGYAILTADYDGVDESVIDEDWEFINSEFALTEGYLFKTDKGFHLICLKKFLPSEIFEILSRMRVDDNYRTMPLRNPYRSYVLRISPKKNGKRPKFVKRLIPFTAIPQTISSAHLNLLKKLYPKLKTWSYPKQDNLKQIKLNVYETK